MPYIYATALTGDIVKIGRGTHPSRALAAQIYYPETVRVLAIWETVHAQKDEKRALRACARWWVRGELFSVPAPWLELEHPIVVLLRGVLGAPMSVDRTPQWKRKGGVVGSIHKEPRIRAEDRLRAIEAKYPQLAGWSPTSVKPA